LPAQKIKAAFHEPMLLLPASTLPEGVNRAYELEATEPWLLRRTAKCIFDRGTTRISPPDIPPSLKHLRRWLQPVLVGQFEYVEWTPDNHLRHSSFVALRKDRDAQEVRREDDAR
jgi:hypothetical protein